MTEFDVFEYRKDWPENDFQRNIFALRLHSDLVEKKITISQVYLITNNDKEIEKIFTQLMVDSGDVLASVQYPSKAVPGICTINTFKIRIMQRVHDLKTSDRPGLNPICLEAEKLIEHHVNLDKCFVCPIFKSGMCVDFKAEKEAKIKALSIYYAELHQILMRNMNTMTFEDLQLMYKEIYEESKEIYEEQKKITL